MSTTLTNGLKLPDKGSVDWYADMQSNYTILDGAVGTVAEHTTQIAGKAPLVHTHTKADITDLFNSANTWSGEQTFSQTIQGNAATASAFDTAKSITLTGAVTGTVSGTNSWEIATVLKTGSAITGSPVTNPYFKIASWEVAPNKYFGAILQIQNKCYPHSFATLIISVRTNTNATFQMGYSILNNTRGFLPSEFILCYKEVTGKVLCELYYYTTTSFNGIRFSVISEGIQVDSSLFNTMTVYQDPTGIAALPSDYTAIQTTIGTYSQDFIPYSNNRYDLGSSSYQWNNLYAKNYFYNGTAWGLDKANLWSGANQFYSSVDYRDPVFSDKNPPSTYRAVDTFKHLGNDNTYWGGLKHNWLTDGYSRLQICVANHRLVNNAWTQGFWAINFAASKDFSDISFYPSTNNSINLGTSTNKWKSFNGVNPGALSLPSGGTTENTDWFNVAGDILPTGGNATSFNKATANYFTPAKDGWLALAVKNCSELSVWCETLKYGISIVAPDASLNRQVVIPVVAGKSYQILIAGNSWTSARLIMPKGNV